MTLQRSPLTDARFHRSSFCDQWNCVAVAALPSAEIAVRDTKDDRPDAPVLRFSATEWEAFVAGVRAGEFSPEALLGR
ncbi:MAG: DUF397 domain-containing protein [Pseudonocardia sp.]